MGNFDPLLAAQTETATTGALVIAFLLSTVKGAVQSIGLVAGVIVALAFTSTTGASLVGVRNFFVSSWLLWFVLIWAYNTIVNFKRVKE